MRSARDKDAFGLLTDAFGQGNICVRPAKKDASGQGIDAFDQAIDTFGQRKDAFD